MKNFLVAVMVVLTSGLAFYFSSYFEPVWFLTWLSPLPVLLFAYRKPIGQTFIVAFLANLGAGINLIIGYWPTSIPTHSFIMSGILQSLEWGIVIIITQVLIKRIKNPLCIFAYPTCLALLEWLQSLTQQGTFSTIANSQLGVLPIIQISAITGFFGISFVVALFPSCIAYALTFWQQKGRALAGLLLGLLIIALVSWYGFHRLHYFQAESKTNITVGLVSVNRSVEKITDPKSANEILNFYETLIEQSNPQKIKLFLFPEEALTVTPNTVASIARRLSAIAHKNKVVLVVGVRQIDKQNYNAAWLFDAQGNWLGSYQKRHFVPNIETQFTAGHQLLPFQLMKCSAGIAICRDMDYPTPARNYGQLGVSMLFVPAWDFSTDADVHFAGALMRSVENGYTLVRSTRSGYLSLSDKTGRIIAKEMTTDNKENILVVSLPVSVNKNYYPQHPYHFVGIMLALLALLILMAIRNRN